MAQFPVNPSQHLLVLVSIILGLGLRDVLTGGRTALTCSSLIVRRAAHAAFALVAILLFVVIVQFWWFLFVIVQAGIWHTNFFSFLLTLARPVLLFIAVSSAFPTARPENLADHYLRNRAGIWIPLLIFEILNLLEFRRYSTAESVEVQLFHLAFIGFALALTFVRSHRVSLMLLSALVPLVFLFIAMFSLSLV